MTTRSLRRYINDLLRGRRPKAFRPDDFEAVQIRTAIDLQAARPGSDDPGEQFRAVLAAADALLNVVSVSAPAAV